MPGQGRPTTRAGLCSRGRAALCLASGLWLLAAALSLAPCAAADIDARIRIAWGGGEGRQWQGTIQVTEGGLSEIMPLGWEADAPGSMLSLDSTCVRIFPLSPRSYDGCDLRVQAPETAKLVVQMAPAGAPAALPIEVPLTDVLRGFWQVKLDDRENRLLAQRSPGDLLRVRLSRDSLIYGPSEPFECEVQPNAPDLAPGATYLLAAALEPARSDEQLWNKDLEVRIDSSGRAAAVPLAVPLPLAEGVYDVRLALYPKRLTTSLVRGKPLASRTVQLVVVEPVQPIHHGAATWQPVLEFDPASPKWWEPLTRLPSWTRLPSLPQRVESEPAKSRNHQSRAWVELAPLAWQAYPLSVAEPGVPHILEVEYPSDVEQTLGISLVEPNAAGQIGPIGLDSGIDVAEAQAGHQPAVRKHRLVCWPQTRTPYVLVVNRRDDRPALVGRINLLAGPRELPPASIVQPNYPARTLAAYYDKPLVAENFSASEVVDPLSRRHLDDWVTFYDGGRRMIQTLAHGGYNAVVMTVACEGSAIYPSRLLEPTPKYDTGVFFESGQDAVRKDVVELLMRLCDRSGIQFIPAVQFSGPLPQLESLRRAGGPGAVGLEPIGPDGQTWLRRHGTDRGMGVYYNALDERVQRAMQAVVSEVVQRYGHHACFGGVAVHLSGESCSLLPDETCSYDDVTFRRFLSETKAEPPAAAAGLSPLAARAQFLQGAGEAAWLQWRSLRLTAMYRQMHLEIAARRSGARLYLTTADLLGGPQVQLALRPKLPPKADPAQLLPLLGLHVGSLLEQGIVVPRPQRIVSAAEPDDRLLHDHFNRWPALDAAFRLEGRGAGLHTIEPALVRLSDFDAKSPFGPDKTRTLLLSEIVPAGPQQRQRFVHSLAALDAPLMIDGGWMLPLGQEGPLSPLVKVFRRLPVEKFTTVQPQDAEGLPSELVVRTLVKDGRTFLYVLNTSPWPLTAEIELAGPQPLRWTPYTDDRQAGFHVAGGRTVWTIALAAFDLVGGEFASDRVQVSSWTVDRPQRIVQRLREQIRDAVVRTNATLRNPPPLRVVPNPSFEAAAPDGAIAGWDHSRGANVLVEIDRTSGHDGQSSLHLASRGADGSPAPVVWVRSDPFPPPATGRLSLIAKIRIADRARQPMLRLAIEGKLNGREYYRKANVGAAENGEGALPLTGEWGSYRFPLNALPLSGLSELRVGFDLMGEGEVWIDNVEVYDLYFEDSERSDLSKNFALAGVQLDSGELLETQRFVEGYWPRFLRRHVGLVDGRPQPAAGIAAPPLPNLPAAGAGRAKAGDPGSGPAAPAAAAPRRAAEGKKSWWPEWLRWR